jgi:hypothetical protein
MNQKPNEQKDEKVHCASVEEAWKNIQDNRSDEIEDSFSYRLFEENYFDEVQFVRLCEHMQLVLACRDPLKSRYNALIWIISATLRSVFSHLDQADLYKIQNFEEIYPKWSGDYLEELLGLLEKTGSVLASY